MTIIQRLLQKAVPCKIHQANIKQLQILLKYASIGRETGPVLDVSAD